jgi:hypothetical protein
MSWGYRKSRLLQFAKYWVQSFAVVVGVAAAIETVVGTKITFVTAAVTVLGCGFLCAVAAWRGTRHVHLPVDDIMPRSSEHHVVLHCPCARPIVRDANKLAAECYGSETIPPERYEQFRVKNPNILVCLTTDKGKLLGYFDAYPLEPTFASAFRSGKVSEQDLTHDDILSPEEAVSCTTLYIAGVAVCNPETYAGRRHASMLIWGLLKYLERFYLNTRERQLLSLGSTEAGENLLQRLNFSVCSSAADRRDKHSLYQSLASAESIREILSSLPDWTGLCQAAWIEAKTSRVRTVHRRPQIFRARARVAKRDN